MAYTQSAEFTFENSLFGAAKLTENADFDKYFVEYLWNMFYCWKVLVFFALSDEYIL